MYKPGDRVYLDASDIKTTCPSPKLSHRQLGPFKIESQVGPSAYCLKLPYGMRQLHPVFNIVKLSAAPEDPILGRKLQAPPVRLANSKAGIKPTAPLSAFDKENSIEFPLDSVHYLYKQSNPNPVLSSRASL